VQQSSSDVSSEDGPTNLFNEYVGDNLRGGAGGDAHAGGDGPGGGESGGGDAEGDGGDGSGRDGAVAAAPAAADVVGSDA